MRYLASSLVLGALLLVLAPPSSGQETTRGRYTVSVVGARMLYDNSSAIEDAWTGGVEAQYNIREWLGLGVYFNAARPTTNGEFFPLVRLEFSDTVINTLISQQVTQLDFGAIASVRVPLGRFQVRGVAGIGRYVFNLDDQRIDSPAVPGQLKDSFGDLSYNIGGAVGFVFGAAGAVEFRIRDFIYTDYDRDSFNLSEPLLAATDVPHPRPDLLFSEKKSTIHNLRLELGFSFTFGGS